MLKCETFFLLRALEDHIIYLYNGAGTIYMFVCGQGRGMKILVPNSVRTRPGQENSENNTKKIQKINKPLSGIISSQNGM